MDEWSDGEGNTLYISTLSGKLFFLKELADPLEAECN